MKRPNPLIARQIRAARALLDWSQDDLATEAGLSVGTVRKIEFGHVSPRRETNLQLRNAFERHGLEFMEPDGVRHRPNSIHVYEGADGVVSFFDDIYQTIRKTTEEIIAVSTKETLFGSDQYCDAACAERLSDITSKAKMKCLVTGDAVLPSLMRSGDCRTLSRHYVDAAQFYVYGDKYAVFETMPMQKIIVIQSLAITKAMRQQFYSMWDKATVTSN